ncbi:MAG: tyrosine-protein phosphatase [Clostridia bacterium]|nr:tyrosine-protein phosphatase [Clostridia bacterium]
MSNFFKIFSIALASILSFSTLCFSASCKDETQATYFPMVVIAQADASQDGKPSIDANQAEDVEIALLTGDIYTVCADYEKYVTNDYNPNKIDVFAPTPIKITWTSEETPNYCEFLISTKNDMSNPVVYMVNGCSVTLENLFMGYDYYYQIYAKFDDKLVKSRIFKFTTEYLPRTVFWGENISNTRDWGGYYTVDGKHRVKQGIVYRGGKLEDITKAEKSRILGVFGIKTDLDLRKDGTGSGSSPLGADVNYVELLGPYYLGGTGIDFGASLHEDRLAYKQALIDEIKVFANPDNFPVYVHCSLGRDRTGTLCFLINALLGVGETDLYRDYEISMMSKMGRLDNQTSSNMVRTFSSLYNYILNFIPGNTLAENAEAYMLSIGITQAEIDAIKVNMLEKV